MVPWESIAKVTLEASELTAVAEKSDSVVAFSVIVTLLDFVKP